MAERPASRRGTTNGNLRGSSEDRRCRREWLVKTFRANCDVVVDSAFGLLVVQPGQGEPACRCYRCGTLLTIDTVSPDRIIPGCEGGTYRRDNIRPACESCQSKTGGALGAARKARKKEAKQ